MRKLLRLVVVLAAVIVVAELLAPSWVASRVEAAIAAETDGRVTVEADISGPPLLVPFALTGEVDSFSLSLVRVAGRDVPVEVAVELHDVMLDRLELLSGDVRVTGLGRATVALTADFSGALPPALQPFADRLAEVGLGQLLAALGEGVVTRRAGALVVGDLALPLVEDSCTVTSRELTVTVRCELAEVPPLLLSAVD